MPGCAVEGAAGRVDALLVAAFANEIASKPADMMDATGLSRPYCATIRRGERVPHARHWGVLRMLAKRSV